MTKPKAVVISDIHFSINTLPLASAALKAAITKAKDLGIPLAIAGDLQDTKAIVRGEVMNELIALLDSTGVHTHVLVGNHDLINEKGSENSLNYLRPYVHVVDTTQSCPDCGLNFVPYHATPEKFLEEINRHEPGLVICHQGFRGAAMGDYVIDKSSVDPEAVKNYRVISGHYHRHQTLGTVTYIGSPYTMTFGEANDGGKGFLILNEDGSFTREIIYLRKHVILERDYNNIYPDLTLCSDDLLWLKVRGPRSELNKLDKHEIGKALIGHSNYKLDLIIDEPNKATHGPKSAPKIVTEPEILDTLIDNTKEMDEQKSYLKALWRELV